MRYDATALIWAWRYQHRGALHLCSEYLCLPRSPPNFQRKFNFQATPLDAFWERATRPLAASVYVHKSETNMVL